MPDLEVEMRLFNARHCAYRGVGVGDLVFSEPISAVEHECRLKIAEISALPKIRMQRTKDSFHQIILSICITRHSRIRTQSMGRPCKHCAASVRRRKNA